MTRPVVVFACKCLYIKYNDAYNTDPTVLYLYPHLNDLSICIIVSYLYYVQTPTINWFLIFLDIDPEVCSPATTLEQ